MLLLSTDPHTFKVKPAIEYYAKLQETDVSIAYAVEVRRKKFNTSFGVMIKMVKGVKGIDPEKVKRV
jgi:polyisoprenoid-binding protein YceI